LLARSPISFVTVAHKDLAILEEVGFVKTDSLPSELDFHDFMLQSKSGGSLGFRFAHATLTHRASELATAIYPDDAVFGERLPNQRTKTSVLISFLEGLKNEPELSLVFRPKNVEEMAVLVHVHWGSTLPLTDFPETMRELIANAEVSQVASDVLRGLHECVARAAMPPRPRRLV
jgi:hypothetical protein